MEGIVKRCDK